MTIPSQFMLVAGMNSTPEGKRPRCIAVYRAVRPARFKIIWSTSGLLLHRIDLHVEVPVVKFCEIASERTGETSTDIRDRVVAVVHLEAVLNWRLQISVTAVCIRCERRDLRRETNGDAAMDRVAAGGKRNGKICDCAGLTLFPSSCPIQRAGVELAHTEKPVR
jgi:predicted ATPase with chaperone activity